jgi:hypothetical protein
MDQVHHKGAFMTVLFLHNCLNTTKRGKTPMPLLVKQSFKRWTTAATQEKPITKDVTKC